MNTYSSDFEYNITGKILRKNQQNKGLIEDTGETVTIAETTYDWNYEYSGSHPNAVTKAGTRKFGYDMNGNMTAMTDSSNSLTRSLLWDEENRLKKTTDTSTSLSASTSGTNSIVTTYEYDAAGMRALKKGKYGTVQYVNENYVVRNKDLISKHVFAGNTRLVSNMVMREEKSGKMVATEQGCYYYHADHLGSSSVVTDKNGKFYEQLEYFPYGETWVHNKAISDDSAQSTPYKFTGKELDPETGLYYYGARYYDAKLSRWESADKAIDKYLPRINDNDVSMLPGFGGVFNQINLDLYHYAGDNPIILIDPDGNAAGMAGAIVGGIWGGVTGGITGAIEGYHSYKNGGTFGDVANVFAAKTTGGAVGGGIAGASIEWGADITLLSGGVATAAGGAVAASGGAFGELTRASIANMILNDSNKAYKEDINLKTTGESALFNLFGFGFAAKANKLNEASKALQETKIGDMRKAEDIVKKVSEFNKKARILNNIVSVEEMGKSTKRTYDKFDSGYYSDYKNFLNNKK